MSFFSFFRLNPAFGARDLHMATKRMSYEYAKSICCRKTWSSGPPVNPWIDKMLILQSLKAVYILIAHWGVIWVLPWKKHNSDAAWGFAATLLQHWRPVALTTRPPGLIFFFKLSISCERIAAVYSWTKSSVVPADNWQSMRWLTKKKKTAQRWFANNVMEQAKTKENVCSRLQGPLRYVFFCHLLSTEFPRKKKKKNFLNFLHSSTRHGFSAGVTRAKQLGQLCLLV